MKREKNERKPIDRDKLITWIISFVIAFLLWTYVMSEVDPVIKRTFFSVPIKYEGLDTLRENDYILMSDKEPTCDVTIRGKRKAINELREDQISARVDLRNVVPGNQSLEIRVSTSNAVLQVEKNSPSNLTVDIDQIKTEEFEITPKLRGELPKDYLVQDTVLNKDKVELKGASRQLDKVNQVIANLEISGKTKSGVVSGNIEILDDQNHVIQDGLIPSFSSTEAQVVISKTVNVPLDIKYSTELPEDFLKERVSISPATVSISGESAIVDRIKSIETEPINPNELMNGQTQQVSLKLPQGTKLINSKESYVIRYAVDDKIEKALEIPVDRIRINNVPKSRTVEILENDPIQIQVSGEASLVEALTETDFTLSLDLKDRNVGKYTVQIQGIGPDAVEILTIEPKEIQIEIKE